MSKPLQWFRLYVEAVDDEKLRLIAFEDRWHFVALLCCKAAGILDDEDASRRARKVAVKLGLDLRELGEVARRLAEVGLIHQETLQPVAWNHRQFQSDSSSERVRAYRERVKRHGNVSETAQETETETETEKKTKTPRVARPSAPSAPPGVSPSLWADWLAVRRAKKQPLTQTALDAVKREAAKAKLSLPDAIKVAVENGWAGFKFSWLQEQAARSAKAGAPDSSAKPWHQTASGIKAKARELGIEEGDDWLAFRAKVYERAGVQA